MILMIFSMLLRLLGVMGGRLMLGGGCVRSELRVCRGDRGELVRLELVLLDVCLRAVKGLSHPFGDQLEQGQDEKYNSNFLYTVLNDLPSNWDAPH